MIKHYICSITLALLSTVSFAQSLDVDPNQSSQGKSLEVEITGQNVNFEPATQTDVIFTRGSVSNSNTDSLDLETVDSTSVSGTLEIGSNFSTGGYDVIFEKNGQEVVREENLFTVRPATGRSDHTRHENSLNADIYPNPFREAFNLRVDVPKAMRLRAKIVNTSGKVVKLAFDQIVRAGEQEIQNLSLSPDLPSGIYLLKVEAQDSQFSTVIRIQKQ